MRKIIVHFTALNGEGKRVKVQIHCDNVKSSLSSAYARLKKTHSDVKWVASTLPEGQCFCA